MSQQLAWTPAQEEAGVPTGRRRQRWRRVACLHPCPPTGATAAAPPLASVNTVHGWRADMTAVEGRQIALAPAVGAATSTTYTTEGMGFSATPTVRYPAVPCCPRMVCHVLTHMTVQAVQHVAHTTSQPGDSAPHALTFPLPLPAGLVSSSCQADCLALCSSQYDCPACYVSPPPPPAPPQPPEPPFNQPPSFGDSRHV